MDGAEDLLDLPDVLDGADELDESDELDEESSLFFGGVFERADEGASDPLFEEPLRLEVL